MDKIVLAVIIADPNSVVRIICNYIVNDNKSVWIEKYIDTVSTIFAYGVVLD